MTLPDFKKWALGERPAFSKRIRMTEREFRGHIASLYGISLQDADNKSHAQEINTLRRFYFKIVVE